MRKRLRLEWSAYALADRSAIFDYIEADSPRASGRQGRIEGTRELVIGRTPYIVAYRITGNVVQILSCAARITALARGDVRIIAGVTDASRISMAWLAPCRFATANSTQDDRAV